jgi:hypothetical protein
LKKGEDCNCPLVIASTTDARGYIEASRGNAWDLAQSVAAELPPYLDDNDLTVTRFWEKNKDRMSQTEARDILEKLAEAGHLEKQERRNRKGGSHLIVYTVKA